MQRHMRAASHMVLLLFAARSPREETSVCVLPSPCPDLPAAAAAAAPARNQKAERNNMVDLPSEIGLRQDGSVLGFGSTKAIDGEVSKRFTPWQK